jgi:hypothetical protein
VVETVARTWRTWLGLGIALLLVGGTTGQPDQEQEVPFWQDRDKKQAACAAELVLARDPFVIGAMRAQMLEDFVWGEFPDIEGDRAPALSRDILINIQDGKIFPQVSNRPKNAIPVPEWSAYQGFNDALVKAFNVSLDAFKKSGEENKTITYVHMMNAPVKYRGDVVKIRGKMTLLRKYDAWELAKARQPLLENVYEGWVFGPTRGANPFCIFFPKLPDGLEPAENMNQEVTFYGYFLTRFKYQSGEGSFKETPVLVGPTVILEGKPGPKAGEEETPVSLIVLGLVMGGFLTMTVVFLVINTWFRRGDDKIRTTISGIKEKHNAPAFVDEDPNQAIMKPGTMPLASPLPPQAYPVTGRDGLPRPSDRPERDPERN